MKKTVLFVLSLILFSIVSFSQKDSPGKKMEEKIKQFWLVMIKTGPSVAAGVFIVDILPWYSEASGSFVPGKPKKEIKENKYSNPFDNI